MKIRSLWLGWVGIAVLLCVAGIASLGAAPPYDATPQAILGVLEEQQKAWNRGDVAEFMKGYWNSPELTFAGASGITRGWEPVMARYRKNYEDPQAMGQLDFSAIEIRVLGKDAALVLGRWHLKRAAGDVGGVFTLVFQRLPEGWKIVHDHTSADAKNQ
jgi:ketosteroid isomerase-like protein